jgi:acyl-homoserine-lactone acylase
MKKHILFLLFSSSLFAQKNNDLEIKRWQKQAEKVTITRDKWGIAHVEGYTDADAVFGFLYAQCEDDFPRVEMNYIEKLGRLSEINGDKYLFNDLQIRLLINENEAKAEYKTAEPWLKKLLNAYADGINYYLYKHQNVKPQLIQKFEPWYPLLWTDGSIGAISTADLELEELQSFYSDSKKTSFQKPIFEDFQQTGSNGFAIAPKLSASGNALLYINPHTSFYYRPEIHIKSNEGLNAYGAVTWGQFFIYQGFNQYCGWMHTSSNADVADTYFEKIVEKNNKKYYEYEGALKPLITKSIEIKYAENGILKSKTFSTFHTQHGPIMAEREGKWLSLKSYNRSKKSLVESFIRTKAKGLEDYKVAMNLNANTSNNTVFADYQGNIAYWHGNYMPIRDNNLNWSKSQDGSKKSTEYRGLHKLSEIVSVTNPNTGWIQNCNSTPFTVSGVNSPSRANYPNYMAPDGENFRGVNAIRLLQNANQMDLDKLINLGFDDYLSAFEVLIPPFVEKGKQVTDPELKEALAVLQNWNFRVNKESIAATLAIEWAQKLNPAIRKVYTDMGESDQTETTKKFINNANINELLPPLKEVLEKLKKNFGTWKVTWGELNRFQRLNGNIANEFDDNAQSMAVGRASALWGCLPSFNSKYYTDSKKRYGFNGNSFICAVEFGKKVKAKSLLAGGVNGSPNSIYFNNQSQIYVDGQFKDVLFYNEDIEKNMVRKYKVSE